MDSERAEAVGVRHDFSPQPMAKIAELEATTRLRQGVGGQVKANLAELGFGE